VFPLNLYADVRFFTALAHETAGAARTRSSLRPLFEGRLRPLSLEGALIATRAFGAARARKRVWLEAATAVKHLLNSR
jgi:hypothetical protein